MALYTRKNIPFVSTKYQRGILRLKNFGKKSHSAEKNTKGDPLVFNFLLQVLKIFGLVRGSNPRTPVSQTSATPTGKNMSKKKKNMKAYKDVLNSCFPQLIRKN